MPSGISRWRRRLSNNMAEKSTTENSSGETPGAPGIESINARIRAYQDDLDRRFDAFALWQLQANEHLCELSQSILDRRWPPEYSHILARSDVTLRFSIASSFRLLTRALVGWCDRFGPKVDPADMTLFISQLLAWAFRSGAYGPPAPLDLLETTLAAAQRAIDRIDVVTGFDSERPELVQGAFGLWATADFGTIGRSGYEMRVDLSTRPILRNAFGICFRANGRRVRPAEFDAAYTLGEASGKYQAFQELKKLLAVLDVSIVKCQLVDLKE